MARPTARRDRPPLDQRKLEELALRYVERFATTRAKLRDYLRRKLRERGWESEGEPDLEPIAERFAELGYIDDAAFAVSNARALAGRGYGKRRLIQKLRVAGVEEADGSEARALADEEAVASALRFAERRRLGPFAAAPVRAPKEREKALAAMVRAGHGFALARAIIALPPGAEIDRDELGEHATGR
ncbi:MAG TPA: RecX family transcriptional regulator [Sphingomicrobium sp.]|nr:RecX family transcriptional regulator [Sphingomicrobium sp.]